MSTPFPLRKSAFAFSESAAFPAPPEHGPSQPRSLTAMRLLPGELPSSQQWGDGGAPRFQRVHWLPASSHHHPHSFPHPTPPSPGPGRPPRTFSCSLTAGMQQNHKGSSHLKKKKKKATQTATASHASPAWRVGASTAPFTHACQAHSLIRSLLHSGPLRPTGCLQWAFPGAPVRRSVDTFQGNGTRAP